MRIRELLKVIHEGLEGSDFIDLDSPVAFVLGDPSKEMNLHLTEGGVASAQDMESGERHHLMYFALAPNEPDMDAAREALKKLLGKESLKHMKTEGNA